MISRLEVREVPAGEFGRLDFKEEVLVFDQDFVPFWEDSVEHAERTRVRHAFPTPFMAEPEHFAGIFVRFLLPLWRDSVDYSLILFWRSNGCFGLGRTTSVMGEPVDFDTFYARISGILSKICLSRLVT